MDDKIIKINRFDQDAMDYVANRSVNAKTRNDDYAKEVNKRLLAGETLYYPDYKMFIKVVRGTNFMVSKDGIYFRNMADMTTPPFLAPERLEIINK